MPGVSSGFTSSVRSNALFEPRGSIDAVLVDQEEEARCLVRDRAEELALALAGGCLLVARGDVDAAGDDPARPPELVVERGGAPEDDPRSRRGG